MNGLRFHGFGHYAPDNRIDNNKISEGLDTNDEWIRTRTGIENRHFVSEGQLNYEVAKNACERAILDAGIDKDDIFILSSGDVLELNYEEAKVTGKVPVGDILVDGLGVGDVGNIVLRDRQHLAEDGIMIVVLALDQASGYLVSGPDIVSRGFVYVKESDELMDEARELMRGVIENCLDRGITDWGKIKNSIKDALGDYVWKKTKRRPMILPIILEV